MPNAAVTCMFSASAAIIAAAAFIEPYRIHITRTDIVTNRLPKSFDGFTIMHLTDLHTRKFGLSERNISRIISRYRPDIVVATGDNAGSIDGVKHFCNVIKHSQAGEGRFAVFGNGEYVLPEMGAQELKMLPDCGVRLLMNENVRLERAGESIIIAGVDDPFTGHADLLRALDGVQAEDFTVLLAHAPNIAVQAVEKGVDLVLSGHTHGGQLKLPFIPAPYAHTGSGPRLESGLYEGESLSRKIKMNAGRTRVFVSRGLGTSYIPVRLFCRPELPIIMLRRG